jgi:glutamate N-acetyltransferase/amino-acid N-acetyltransferase
MGNGVAAGIKDNGKKDLSLIFSTAPAKAAGVFTTNAFKAAPVLLDMERIGKGTAQAIVTNSGNANAATGGEGYENAREMARAAAEELRIREDLVLVASTGVIGQPLPIGRILSAMGALASGLKPEGLAVAEEAIMTTDRYPKMSLRKCLAGGKEVTLFGMAKGAGMIEPNMATLLSYVLTDADVDGETMKRVFREAVARSFNAISVDGCMSTNDTVLFLANGVAGNRPLKAGSAGFGAFRGALFEIMEDLARSIVRDGEGATRVLDIRVEGARSKREARTVAYAVARSNLVKAAFYGKDPNWGRIISAAGSVGVPVDPEDVLVSIGGVPIFAGGSGTAQDEGVLREIMERPEIPVLVRLGTGKGAFRVFASDLTHDYVSINAHYRT